jgi:hypothetical protein
VQQAAHDEPVAALVVGPLGDAPGETLRRQRVQPEALGRRTPDLGALEEVKRWHRADKRVDPLRRERLDRTDDRVYACTVLPRDIDLA